MVDLGRLDAMIKRPECDFCSLVVLGCKQTWQGSGTWEDALESTDTKCFINALELTGQRAKGYVLQITEMHRKKPLQWVEFEVVCDHEGIAAQPVDRFFEVCPKVDFELMNGMLRYCEENHHIDNDPIPTTRIEPNLVINVKEMSVVVAPPICRYCTLSYVVSSLGRSLW
jgi:hypothetical protein